VFGIISACLAAKGLVASTDLHSCFWQEPVAENTTAPAEAAAYANASAVAAAERAASRGNSDRSHSSGSDALVEAALDEASAEARGPPAGDEAGKADDGSFCSVAKFESALQSAFNRTDEEFGKADNAALVGTTAVVALVGSRHLYVANCGARLRPALAVGCPVCCPCVAVIWLVPFVAKFGGRPDLCSPRLLLAPSRALAC